MNPRADANLQKFFLRTADSDVHRYLKLFTFEPLEVLETLMEEHNKDPAKRIAQHKLADEVLKLVHGKEVANGAKREHGVLFKRPTGPEAQTDDGGTQSPESTDNAVPLRGTNPSAPTHSIILPKSLVYDQRMSHVLYHAGAVPSRSQGHRLLLRKGVYMGARPAASGTMGDHVEWSPAADWQEKETQKYIIGDDTLIFRVGKWKVKIVKIVSDEEFEKQGLSAPGWKDDTPPEGLSHNLRDMKTWHKKNYIKNSTLHAKTEGGDDEMPPIRHILLDSRKQKSHL